MQTMANPLSEIKINAITTNANSAMTPINQSELAGKDGKHSASEKAREFIERVSSAGKHATSAKRANSWKGYQARENMQLVQNKKNMQLLPSTRIHITGTKRGKTCKQCQARENMQPLSTAKICNWCNGKYRARAKSGKTSKVTIGFGMFLIACIKQG